MGDALASTTPSMAIVVPLDVPSQICITRDNTQLQVDGILYYQVKVLRYEIKDLTPPKEILHAMQAQITAEREKRALIAASEGRKQEQINIASHPHLRICQADRLEVLPYRCV
jgi:regulator of protease activity HflC (stomatin/prohibitin superfamily)